LKIQITNLKARLLAHPSPAYMIAAAAQVDPSTLTQYATGKRPIPLMVRRRLAEVLECDASDLVGTQEYELTSLDDG